MFSFSFVAYTLTIICALAFVTNLVRCLKFMLFSSNVELTVEQQQLFGVTDFGRCSNVVVASFFTRNGSFITLKNRFVETCIV